MSDGPHRSLPLRAAWKRVCEIADGAAHSLEEVVERIAPALAADIRGEVDHSLIARLRRILVPDPSQPALFDDVREQVASLRSRAASTLEADLIDAVNDALRNGHAGLGALKAGAEAALEDRAHATINSVVEHYLRRVPHERAANVGQRLLSALDGARASLSTLAGGFAAGRMATAMPAGVDRSSLDDGPSL
jgi:hypothetical protein